MLNNRDENRDEKFEDHEESEYHFSDDEVSYEADTETPKKSVAAPTTELKESVLNRLSRSKRMLISLGVFLVLVFVIYKMVAPTSTTPATDISPKVAQKAPVTKPVAVQEPSIIPVTSNVASTTQPVTSVATQSAPATQEVIAPTPGPAVQMVQPPANQANMVAPQATVAPQQQPVASVPQQQPQAFVPQQQQVIAPQQQIIAPSQQLPAQMSKQPVPQQAAAVTPGMQTAPSQVVAPMPIQAPSAAAMNTQIPENAMTNLAIANDKLMAQLQADYVQKFNAFTVQNKALQDQIQTLNSRVAAMEGQLNQLVNTLSRPHISAPSVPHPVEGPPPPPREAPLPRVSYSVQAIIPGRAWLRAENGETVTVAEGDVIRGLGRVTKIDPYDGVVEINTGSRVISISYGNGV